MNIPANHRVWTPADHEAALDQIEGLMTLDPARGTPDGQRLSALVEACEAYEKIHFPEIL